MTDNSLHEDIQLPSFPVHVVRPSDLTGADLELLLERFDRDELDPLIIGREQGPEAALIPMSAFVRLLRCDHAAQIADQEEIAHRVQASNTARAHGDDNSISLEELADELGGPAADILRRIQNDAAE